MDTTFRLDKMTISEKLRMMEVLWVDLTKSQEKFTSPNWHADVLKAREERIKSGKEEYKDWEIAKKELRDRHL